MFEGVTQGYIGVLEGVSAGQNRQLRDLDDQLTQAKRDGWAWRKEAEALQARVAELEQKLALKQALDEADDVLLGEWKKTHPCSPLMQAVGRRRDGSALSRGLSIWMAAFDANARRLGINDPEAHRIS